MATGGIILFISASSNAAIISTDWQVSGDNLITQDTNSGLEWLDLTVTSGQAYLDSAQLSVGGDYEGWRYATVAEVTGFLDAFGGDSTHYNGWSTENEGLFDVVSQYWGDLYCSMTSGCDTGDGHSLAFTSEFSSNSNPITLYISESTGISNADQDLVMFHNAWGSSNAAGVIGSALVREVSPVPVPAAVWLFGSGLIGLAGMARRKKA